MNSEKNTNNQVFITNQQAALRAIIEEGWSSGIVEDFDPEAFLQQMKARKHGKVLESGSIRPNRN